MLARLIARPWIHFLSDEWYQFYVFLEFMQWEIMQLLCCRAAVNWKQSRPINIGSKRSCQIIIMHVSMGHYNYTQSYRNSSHKVALFSLYSSPPLTTDLRKHLAPDVLLP